MSVEEVLVVKGHRGEVTGLAAVAGRPGSFLSCAEDGSVRMWDLNAHPNREVSAVTDLPNGDDLMEVLALGGNESYYWALAIGGSLLSKVDMSHPKVAATTLASPGGEDSDWCSFDKSHRSYTGSMPSVRYLTSVDEEVVLVLNDEGAVVPVLTSSMTVYKGTARGQLCGGDGNVMSEWAVTFDGPFGSHTNIGVAVASLAPDAASGAPWRVVSVGMDAVMHVYGSSGEAHLKKIQSIEVGGWGENQQQGQMIANPPLPTSLSPVQAVPGEKGEPALAVGRGDGTFFITLPIADDVSKMEMALAAPGHETNGLIGAHFLSNEGILHLSTTALSAEVSVWKIDHLMAAPAGDEEEEGGDPELVFAHGLRDAAKGNTRSPISRLVANASCPTMNGEYVAVADGFGRINAIRLDL